MPKIKTLHLQAILGTCKATVFYHWEMGTRTIHMDLPSPTQTHASFLLYSPTGNHNPPSSCFSLWTGYLFQVRDAPETLIIGISPLILKLQNYGVFLLRWNLCLWKAPWFQFLFLNCAPKAVYGRFDAAFNTFQWLSFPLYTLEKQQQNVLPLMSQPGWGCIYGWSNSLFVGCFYQWKVCFFYPIQTLQNCVSFHSVPLEQMHRSEAKQEEDKNNIFCHLGIHLRMPAMKH